MDLLDRWICSTRCVRISFHRCEFPLKIKGICFYKRGIPSVTVVWGTNPFKFSGQDYCLKENEIFIVGQEGQIQSRCGYLELFVPRPQHCNFCRMEFSSSILEECLASMDLTVNEIPFCLQQELLIKSSSEP